MIIESENLNTRFGLNLSDKDYTDHKGVDASILSWWQKEPAREATLKCSKENFSDSILRLKGAG